MGRALELGMYQHHSVRTRPGRLVFTRHDQAAVLWSALVERLPDLRALCLMPDHVHLLHSQDVTGRLGAVLGGYSQWRNGQQGTTRPLWRPREHPEPVRGSAKARTVERYIHLNPCRAGLVRCPLAWAWSTHRDRVGLADPAVRGRAHDPHAYHRYVSGDPSTAVQGTPWPLAVDVMPPIRASLVSVQAAVSAVTRQPLAALDHRGPARTLFVRAARALTLCPCVLIADFTGLSPRSVRRTAATWGDDLARLSRVLDDPRFEALDAADLRSRRSWLRYRDRR